jgi:hypothetical protein
VFWWNLVMADREREKLWFSWIGMLSDATYNSGLTLSTQFALPDSVRRQGAE